MLPELAIQTEDREVACEPAGLARQGLPHDPGFAQAMAADQNKQVEVALRKGLDHLLQLEVGRHAYSQRCGFDGLAHEGDSRQRKRSRFSAKDSPYLA